MYQQIVEKLEAIKRVRKDPGVAHGSEDALYLEFVKFVAYGLWTRSEIKQCAQLVLTSQDIDFPRWTE